MTFRDAARRLGVAALCALTVVYPVRAWFVLDGVPLSLKGLWVGAFLAAWRWPTASLIAFLAGAPLLGIVPTLLRLPPVSLGSVWLWALLVPAWLRVIWRGSTPRLPLAAMVLLLVATASLVVGLYPLHLARFDLGQLGREIHDYLWIDLVVASSQRPVLSPLLAWVTLAEGLGCLWLACRALGPPRHDGGLSLAGYATAVGVGAGAVGVWAVEQWWTQDNLLPFWVEQDPFITRVNASFTDVNALGAYLASSVAVIMAVAASRASLAWRVAWSLAAVIVTLGTLFTGSRIAWFAAGLAIGLYGVGLVLWRLGPWSDVLYRRLRRLTAVAGVAGLALVVTLIVWASVRDVRYADQRNYLDTVFYTLNLRAPISERLKGRGEFWQAALNMMAARPLTGIGLGRYFKDVSAWAPHPETLVRPQENAHNYFLQMGAELGVPGAACIILLIGAAVARGLRYAGGTDPVRERRIQLAAALGVTAFAVTSLTGHSLLLREGQLTFWALAAMPLALSPFGAGQRARPRWHAWVTPATALLLLATLPTRMSHEAARVDLARVTIGLHDEEQTPDGTMFRWMGPRAVFYVPPDARVVTFDVRGVAPFTQTLEVRHGGKVIEQVVLDSHTQGWHSLRYVLPAWTSNEGHRRFELRVTPPWHPAGDPRTLGVMVRGIGWS